MDDIPPTERKDSQPVPTPGDDEKLARTRLQFLTAEAVEEPNHVRDSILSSWWRSLRYEVPADRIQVPYYPEQDLDTPLIHGAKPVMDRLGDQLEGQPVSLILTDPKGVVLSQRTGDSGLHRHLERVELVPGFSYGEQFVGTNGIGTALEEGRATHVFGHEHYAENLERLACAGVPIQHPITGKAIGAIDLTCWRKDAGGLLIALARTTAEQIRQGLLTQSSSRELALFESYLQSCRRTSGVVVAFNDDVVMINDCGRQLLDSADQSLLLEHACQALAESRRSTATITLSTGNKVRMQCRRAPGHRRGDSVGGVLVVKPVETDDDSRRSAEPRLPMFLPGVVGSAPLWLQCCHDVNASYESGEWLILTGERGVGKYALTKGVNQRRNPAGRIHAFDAAAPPEDGWGEELRRDLVDDPVDTLVLRHLDQLDGDAVGELVTLLREAGSGGASPPWVAVTLESGGETSPGLTELLPFFPRTVQVPPLRRRIDDLSELVPLLLNNLGHGGQLTCSPAAMHLLKRASWPGNTAQLCQVLKQVAAHRRTGVIQPHDLPAQFRTVNRRSLNRIESVERDAIVASLEEAGGNKVRAARLLGMSRATIYRKINDYGIVTPCR